jgi:hypothetical protein
MIPRASIYHGTNFRFLDAKVVRWPLTMDSYSISPVVCPIGVLLWFYGDAGGIILKDFGKFMCSNRAVVKHRSRITDHRSSKIIIYYACHMTAWLMNNFLIRGCPFSVLNSRPASLPRMVG